VSRHAAGKNDVLKEIFAIKRVVKRTTGRGALAETVQKGLESDRRHIVFPDGPPLA
jgi:hypothetical protein